MQIARGFGTKFPISVDELANRVRLILTCEPVADVTMRDAFLASIKLALLIAHMTATIWLRRSRQSMIAARPDRKELPTTIASSTRSGTWTNGSSTRRTRSRQY
jgi:hypothetical protein